MIYFGGGGRGAQSLKAFLKKGMRLNWNFWRGSGVQTNKLKKKTVWVGVCGCFSGATQHGRLC